MWETLYFNCWLRWLHNLLYMSCVACLRWISMFRVGRVQWQWTLAIKSILRISVFMLISTFPFLFLCLWYYVRIIKKSSEWLFFSSRKYLVSCMYAWFIVNLSYEICGRFPFSILYLKAGSFQLSFYMSSNLSLFVTLFFVRRRRAPPREELQPEWFELISEVLNGFGFGEKSKGKD